jgi:5-oxoprolinase (ATP-hydrolysing) subunit A
MEAAARCRERGIRIGAHPGYPDPGSMGRQSLSIDREREYLKSLFDQVKWFVSAVGATYLKPHGGFYNDTGVVLPPDWEWSHRRQLLATRYENGGVFLAQFPGMQSLMMLLRIHRLPLMGLESTSHLVLAERAGQPLIREGFADRAYTDQGTLVPRSQPDALLTDPLKVQEQVLRLAPSVDSICLHGDTPNCVEFAEIVYRTLVDEGYEIGVPQITRSI